MSALDNFVYVLVLDTCSNHYSVNALSDLAHDQCLMYLLLVLPTLISVILISPVENHGSVDCLLCNSSLSVSSNDEAANR